MSELKVYRDPKEGPCWREFYEKSETDKVISELKAQVNGFYNRANLWEYNAQNEHNAAVAVRMENAKLKAKLAEKDKEIAELKEQYKDMDVKHTVHIAKMNALIEELEESQRWRKCSEEKPNEEGDYLVMARYPDDDEPHVEICFYDRVCEDFGHYERRYSGSGNSFGGFDGEEWVTHNVSFWRPLPSAPKEEK